MKNSVLTEQQIEFLKYKFGLVGLSVKMLQTFELLFQVAPTDLNVLITGETGTGKEVFANAIHQLSNRKNSPFISVNCGAIPETLLESELFGHEKGAFTGAYDQRKGYFEVADRGTIFLDEIGEIPIGTQVKLLRVIESGEFSRLGSTQLRWVDVRVIAATNRILEEEIARGNFREDLYYRLKNVHILLPPLRERPEDIPLLIEYFAKKTCEKLGIRYEGIDIESLNILRGMQWPGNVRELRNLIETIVQLEKTGYLSLSVVKKYLPPALPPYKFREQPKESSLIPLQRQEDAKLGFELIFRTLLELKKDLDVIKSSIDFLNSRIDTLHSNIVELKPESHHYVVDSEKPNINENNLKFDDIEKELIKFALKKHKGNRRQTARELGISERTLYRKINQYNLE
ncbi:MAG: sigma-54 interaction domain-containing protein [Candidatus Kapaibacteriales bacterium]